MSISLVILVGRLAADPEVRYTQSGKAVAQFPLAVDRGYGEKKKTSFINCEAWEKQAETIGNTLTKGRKVIVRGEWAQQNWEAADGQKRRKDYCLIQSFEYADSKNQQGSSGGQASGGNESPMDAFGKDVFPEEEIPF